jgi:hypothetical protein
MAVTSIYAQTPAQTNRKTSKSAETVYTCPMHPEVHSDKPGKCPKCGMTLVKKKANSSPTGREKKDSTSMKGMKM